METQWVLVSTALREEGLSDPSEGSSETTHLADKGNRADITRADLCVALDLGCCDSLPQNPPHSTSTACVYREGTGCRQSPGALVELHPR